jgi:hypothetical protein
VTEGDADGQPSFLEADRVFRECARRAARAGSRMAPVARQLRLAAERLRQPMRLAVVGQIKRGKSTLVNALLGEHVAATGQLELTFTVSEFRHADDRAIYVHYKDGTIEGPLPPELLDSLTVRNPAAMEKLQKIRKVEFAMPNELLRAFRLVDTPGLGSVHQADAQNSLDYLGMSTAEFATEFADEQERATMRRTLAAMHRTAADLHADSAQQVAEADAVVYLFSRGMHASDYQTVARFLGPAARSVTPLRAFGVLSRCDQNYWPPDRDLPGSPDPAGYDPMAAAARIADRYLAEPGIGTLFYTVLPVAGLVGAGAQLLTPAEFGWLGELCRTEPRVLVRSLRDVARFAAADELPGILLPTPIRAELIARLGGWGTHLACCYLRDHLGEDEVRQRLVDASGVTRLRDLISRHYGNRASVIKLDHGIRDVTAEIGRRRLAIQLANGHAPPALDDIAARIERLRQSEHGAAELIALAAYYQGGLRLSEQEVRELLAVTGEYGTSWAARLGLPGQTRAAELEAAARRLAATWADRERDPALDRATRPAVRAVRRSFDRIWHQVTEARNGGAVTQAR